VVVANRTQKTA